MWLLFYRIGKLIITLITVGGSLVETGATLAAVGGVLYLLFTSNGWAKLQTFVQNQIRAAVRASQPLLTELLTEVKPVLNAYVSAIETAATDIRTIIEAPAALVADSAFTLLRDSLYVYSNVQPADWVKIASDAFADATTWGIASAAFTGVFESIFPEKLNTLNAYGPMFKEMAGFHEVQAAYLRPILQNAIAIPAGYDAHQQFRAVKPSLGQGQQMYSRRYIDLADFQQIQAWAGIDPTWQADLDAITFRPISPRALATLLQDVPFDTQTMTTVLQDNGLNDVNVQFMLDSLEYASTKNVRQQYVSALVQTYEHGAMSDQELQSSLGQLGWSTTAINYVTQTVALRRRIVLAQKVAAQVSPLVAAGQMTAVEGTQQLEAAGLQPWFVDLEVTLAETKAVLAAARKAAAAEAKQLAAEQKAGIKSIVEQFHAGIIDAAALAAALTVAGMDPIVTAATVATEEAKRLGNVRTLYGQQLTAAQAAVLKDQVAAIVNQMKKELITPTVAYAQLKALGIDDAELNPIFARAAAELGALTTHGVLINPQTGQTG